MSSSWDNVYGQTYKLVTNSAEKLPPAVYTLHEDGYGTVFFNEKKQKGDRVLDLPGLPNKLIIEQIDKFWNNRSIYEAYKFIHKRGILLYGPPGNGKTCVIAALIDNVIKRDGLVISVAQFDMASKALSDIRKAEPDRPLMTVIEDMDTLLSGENKSQEQAALSMLGGQNQVSGVVHIGTTNYPEQLADRFIKRPGRFDLIVGMTMPVKDTRRAYFEHVLNDPDHPEIDYLVDKTEGLSLAYLREIASSYLCLGIPIEETVGRLKKNASSAIRISKSANVGFKIGYEEMEPVAETKPAGFGI